MGRVFMKKNIKKRIFAALLSASMVLGNSSVGNLAFADEKVVLVGSSSNARSIVVTATDFRSGKDGEQ